MRLRPGVFSTSPTRQVVPFAAAVGEVLAAHGFGVLCQAAREIGGGLPHGDLQ